MENTDCYVSPFSQRYASKEMQYLHSQDFKFTTWRKLWVMLAESEKQLGLPISDEQIAEMRQHVSDINYEDAVRREHEIRHDVMSHIYAYGLQCPKAAGIIHLGATSCYVGDNTDIIIMKRSLDLIRDKLVRLIRILADFARKHKSLPTLAYTHFQPAQPTTVGKRAVLWLDQFVSDLQDLEYVSDSLRLLGCKGTTGTQASFLALFEGDKEKVRKLEDLIAQKVGIPCCPVSGQTYSRKYDSRVINVLSGIGQSAHKLSNDLRLLQHLKEVEEPFEKDQVGSSAMPYKRNPMRCERIAALSRYLITDSLNPALTASEQWLERTLDDSANRRIAIAEGFLAADGILNLLINVCDGLVVYPAMIEAHLQKELPFMASENIMMRAVKAGGNRQKLHEKLRVYSQSAGQKVKSGGDNDLLERIENDSDFHLNREELKDITDPAAYIGLAADQVEEYLNNTVEPLLAGYRDISDESIAIEV